MDIYHNNNVYTPLHESRIYPIYIYIYLSSSLQLYCPSNTKFEFPSITVCYTDSHCHKVHTKLCQTVGFRGDERFLQVALFNCQHDDSGNPLTSIQMGCNLFANTLRLIDVHLTEMKLIFYSLRLYEARYNVMYLICWSHHLDC